MWDFIAIPVAVNQSFTKEAICSMQRDGAATVLEFLT
jgi:hypothetical protein